MKTQHILTIIAMAALGLCLVLAFSKRLTKNLKTKETMSHIFSFLVFIAIALVAVTQFLSEKENMDWEIGSVETASMPNGGRAKKGGKKVSMGVGDITCNENCPCDANAPRYICSPHDRKTGDSTGKTNTHCKKCSGIKDTTTCPKGDYCEDWSN